jgi:hypothetical protein
MVATVCPTSLNAAETGFTLAFAHRTRSVSLAKGLRKSSHLAAKNQAEELKALRKAASAVRYVPLARDFTYSFFF